MNLKTLGYVNGSVCHKYNFVAPDTGINTQAIESFNNLLKI